MSRTAHDTLTARKSIARWVLVLGILASSLLLGANAHAQESDEGPLSWFTFTPRLWISAVDTGGSDVLSVDTFVIPMFGMSATMTQPLIPNLSFALTVLGGEGEADTLVTVDSAIGDIRDADGDLVRVDIEFLARYQIGDSPVSAFFGPRYIRFEEDYSGNGVSIESTENDVALQIGLGTASDLGESGRHRLFVNIATGVVFVDSEIEVTADGATGDDEDTDELPMFDLNAGYQYVWGDRVSFDARYRVFMVFNEDANGFDSTFLVHGPELGATFRF